MGHLGSRPCSVPGGWAAPSSDAPSSDPQVPLCRKGWWDSVTSVSHLAPGFTSSGLGGQQARLCAPPGAQRQAPRQPELRDGTAGRGAVAVGAAGTCPGAPRAAALAAMPQRSAAPPYDPNACPWAPAQTEAIMPAPGDIPSVPWAVLRSTHAPRCPCSQDVPPSPSPCSASALPSLPLSCESGHGPRTPPSPAPAVGPSQGLTRQEHWPLGALLVHEN